MRFKQTLTRGDILASLVVFFVALPLCMGVAIASGVSPAAGLVTGMVGGILIGAVSGSTFQVSGPTVSLALIVWDVVDKLGVGALSIVVTLAGIWQIGFGMLKLGRIFRAVSPAVVQGMLSGIGLLILVSQFHVMLDDKPKGTGLQNLLAIPELLYRVLTLNDGTHEAAALTGLLTIAVILIWEKLPVEKLRNSLPPTLLAIVVATTTATVLALDLNRVQLPDSLLSALRLPDLSVVGQHGWTLVQQGLVVALVASAETLLTANALDRMVTGHKSKYDRELVAQGIGNTVCGAIGALPSAGVIVRSVVNVKAGAQTKASTILHGLWILVFASCFPIFLRLIPTASLAAVLVYAGYRLIDVRAARLIGEHGRFELVIFFATALTILATDLLKGVIVGVAMGAAKLLYVFCKLDIVERRDDGRITLSLIGAATFLSLPKLAEVLDELPADTELHIDFSCLTYIDHASLDMLMKWEEQYKSQGGTLTIDWGLLHARFKSDQLAPKGSVTPESAALE